MNRRNAITDVRENCSRFQGTSRRSVHMLSVFKNVILEEGERFAGLLYTWRSLSRAVPAVRY